MKKIMGIFSPKNMQFIGIGSVSADMKKKLSVIYRISRFKKWHLSVYIGIGRYEKKLIGRTLHSTHLQLAFHGIKTEVKIALICSLVSNTYFNAWKAKT